MQHPFAPVLLSIRLYQHLLTNIASALHLRLPTRHELFQWDICYVYGICYVVGYEWQTTMSSSTSGTFQRCGDILAIKNKVDFIGITVSISPGYRLLTDQPAGYSL